MKTAYRPRTAAEQHRLWLELMDIDGPFLAVPELKRVWPQGIPTLADEPKQLLREALPDFERAWEAYDQGQDDEGLLADYRIERDKWVESVLRNVIGWGELLEWGDIPGIQAASPNGLVTVYPQAVLRGPDAIGAVVMVIDPTESLRLAPTDQWAATPIDRMETLLRASDVPIGVVTDGRWWGLVSAGKQLMAASGVVDALDWIAEPRTRDAFFTILSRQYIVGGDPDERLPKLFERSVAAAEEITEALGSQVRSAVELLIQSFSEASTAAIKDGLADPLPGRSHDVYEAAVTVMMRVVFLLFAEERGLLPTGELFQQGYGIASELDRLESAAAESEEALDDTSLTWHRLLATSRALYDGASFENMRMPAYGGSLFDPARFPFLTAAGDDGTLALAVPDRVLLHVLRSVQIAQVKGEARRISFRDIDVEQIGYIYEGLLGYTAVRVDQVYLGLKGTSGEEPELPLDFIDDTYDVVAASGWKAMAERLRDEIAKTQPSAKPPSAAALAKGLAIESVPEYESQLSRAVGGDEELKGRIGGWLGIMRTDLRGYPFVVLPGGLMVKETPSRKNAGAHYTPKSLAEEVVLYALQPLCYAPGPHQTSDTNQWKLKSSSELLDLKVADIACGSGAFLVAAARYLADRVAEAWLAEDPANIDRRDLRTRAIRQVVANCLYGADINDMAVEMCKLSLWLVSLDRDLPFSFVDDKIFLGNSLLGLTDLNQLKRLHIDPTRVSDQRAFDIFSVDVDKVIQRAAELRRTLASPVDDADPARSSTAKKHQLTKFREVTAELRTLADGVIAAGLPLGGKPGRALDEAYENLRIAVKQAENGDPYMLDRLIDKGLTPTVETDYERWQPLHWMLEVPDVVIDHGGFDALVGNPPFLGGLKLTAAMGVDVRDWLVHQVANSVKGAADLVAYFLLRANLLISNGGHLGLIATNTVAQGDTREVGLDQIVGAGGKIIRAVQSEPWPALSASISYAAVWIAKFNSHSKIRLVADDVVCRSISTLLEPSGRISGTPFKLRENSGIAFIGSYPLGAGFMIDEKQAEAWIDIDDQNRKVLKPYLTGSDLNGYSSVFPKSWIIDFNERSLEESEAFEEPFEHVERFVKPERARNADRSRRENWWRFTRTAPGLRSAIEELTAVSCIRQTSTTMLPVRVATGPIFDQTMTVFASSSYSFFAIIASSVHSLWVIQRGVTLGSGPRYTPSDVFETFPRPDSTEWLSTIGCTLDQDRAEIMRRRDIGLTKLYNLVNDPAISNASDPDVARMREIHVELDQAVMDAYGWSDVELDHGFHTYRQMERWTVSPAARVEILDRLLEENHRRAALEKEVAKQPRTKRPTSAPQDGLFG